MAAVMDGDDDGSWMRLGNIMDASNVRSDVQDVATNMKMAENASKNVRTCHIDPRLDATSSSYAACRRGSGNNRGRSSWISEEAYVYLVCANRTK